MTALPHIIPLFPLPDVVLFPPMPLPLHIFEPRYREMVRDAIERPERLIGMVLLRGDWRPRYFERPEIFQIGCAGRIVNVENLPDGRYNILLHGVREFAIREELEPLSYRLARVQWREAAAGALPTGMRERMCKAIERLLQLQPSAPARKLLEDRTISDELFVNFFCYALEFAPVEKQGLLEAATLHERAERLEEMIEFALSAGMAPRSEKDAKHFH